MWKDAGTRDSGETVYSTATFKARYLALPEYRRLFAAVDAQGGAAPVEVAFIRFLAYTGARRKRRVTSPYVFPHPSRPDRPRPLPTDWTWRVIKREAAHDNSHREGSGAVVSISAVGAPQLGQKRAASGNSA